MPQETHGARRRRAITRAAIDLSTIDGLATLSLSDLADAVGLSKPGVASHFDSKEALQLAAVGAAAEAYADPLLQARASTEPGLERLAGMMRAWLDYLASAPYRGGCFFAAAGHDFSGRPGAVRDAIAHHTRRFQDALEEEAQLAARLGELRAEVVPTVLAFTLHALPLEANLRRELLDDDEAFDLARRALDAILASAAVPTRRSARRSGKRARR